MRRLRWWDTKIRVAANHIIAVDTACIDSIGVCLILRRHLKGWLL